MHASIIEDAEFYLIYPGKNVEVNVKGNWKESAIFFSLPFFFFFFLYIGCILNWNKFFQKIGITFERIFLLGLMRPVGRDNIIKNIFLYILLRAFEEF